MQRRPPRFEALVEERPVRAVTSIAKFAWPAAFVAIAAMGFGYLRESRTSEPKASEIRVDHDGATVIREIRALSKLETGSLRVEKVIALRDHQRRLHGLVEADDALLFVAAGEVVMGVDLTKLGPEDVRFDSKTGVASIDLPTVEVLSTRFDESKSYVHTRNTDALARRNEGLEAAARRDALAAFATAGRDASAIESAKASAERQLRALAKAWGAKDLVLTWKAPAGEVAVSR